MENHQLKTNEIPSVENEVKSSSGFQSLPERLDVESIDEMLNQVIEEQIPPFVVTEDNNIRREDYTAELDSEPECNIKEKILSYNRKDKSLMELTRKFICKFQGATTKILVLDQITVELKVERRRIYDIINIMESLNVVSKVKKNVYQWKGLKKAVETIQFYSKSCQIEQFEKGKKQKSLESLATQFLKLFSQRKTPLTLEQAAQIILSESNEQVKKTKIRRLYDIVNVFKCLGLVQKVKGSKFESGKPIYEWLGCYFLLKIIESNGKNVRTLAQHDDALNSMSQINSMKDDTENMETNSRFFKPVHLENIGHEENQNRNKSQIKDLAMTDIQNYQNNMSIGNMNRKSSMSFDSIPTSSPIFKKLNSSPDYEERPKMIKHVSRKIKLNYVQKINEEPSFFHGLFNHLNVTGSGSISDVYDRLTSMLWPN